MAHVTDVTALLVESDRQARRCGALPVAVEPARQPSVAAEDDMRVIDWQTFWAVRVAQW
jgi:hypothetical protein